MSVPVLLGVRKNLFVLDRVRRFILYVHFFDAEILISE